ncbi:C6 finger domain transcription factor adaR [Fulvia fulva]|nr:C6 finger domain transcription factor adaR [Fulvia fulva]WPV18314.1 C6 finger domain transcription factor adaR [Fulvia fulva]WPV33112.1 C6 finger domain transcription factor adaR [Fulvia fulva]
MGDTSAAGPRPLRGLACQECHRRKIKCNRTFPCERCTRMKLKCVPNSRRPRAKNGAADKELRQRIAKLEALVGALPESDISKKADLEAATQSPSGTLEAPSTTPAKATGLIASDFWASLSLEVKALADVFDDEDRASDQEQDDQSPSRTLSVSSPSESVTSGFDPILCLAATSTEHLSDLQTLDSTMVVHLFNNYLQYVEPLYKIFHVPTLRALVVEGKSYLGRSANASCNMALRASILFAGINSMKDHECLSIYGKSLDQLVSHFKRLVDTALFKADPLTTTDMATVQALTLYAVTIRIIDPSRRAWSIIGTLIRIARAMEIYRDSPGDSAFLTQIRRRLWSNIVSLDAYCSFDRGSIPALPTESFSQPMPANCNDEDFDEDSLTVTDREGQITGMTLALVARTGYEASFRMALPGFSWEQRLEIARDTHATITEKYSQYCDPTIPAHEAVLRVAIVMNHSMILHAVRPINVRDAGSPPKFDSPWVMELALNLLRPAAELWVNHEGGYRTAPWVPWHSMAVILAGLCSIRDAPMTNEAWNVISVSMDRYCHDVADGRQGMLWKALEKLHKKATAFQNASLPVGTGLQAQVLPQLEIPQTAAWDANLIPILNADVSGLTDVAMMEFDPNLGGNMCESVPVADDWLDWEALMRDLDDMKAGQML